MLQLNLSFFLLADPKIRAQRRHKQINDLSVKVESIEKEIKTRDNIDSTREIAPLKKADDAFEIDVSCLNIEEVFEKLTEIRAGYKKMNNLNQSA